METVKDYAFILCAFAMFGFMCLFVAGYELFLKIIYKWGLQRA